MRIPHSARTLSLLKAARAVAVSACTAGMTAGVPALDCAPAAVPVGTVTGTSPPLVRAGSPARRARRPAGPERALGPLSSSAGPGPGAADVTRRRPVPRPRQCTATQRQWTSTRASLPVASCERAPSHDRRDPQVFPPTLVKEDEALPETADCRMDLT